MTILILGAGLAGLSCSYHLGHERCRIIEKSPFICGHAATYSRDGAYWDEGPHISFTKHPYVQALLTRSAGCELLSFPTDVGNWYQGHWIPHPAQSNLHAVPEPIASQCLQDFLIARQPASKPETPANYQQWLDQAFGVAFSRTFPHAYTRKYWTCDPECLATDWVGERVYFPTKETVLAGYQGDPKANTHYISSVRYPAEGGFQSFFRGLSEGANVANGEVVSIDLRAKRIELANGECLPFDSLINTIPLNRFVGLLRDVPQSVHDAADQLCCSSLLLVNIIGTQKKTNPYHWLYVYDEDKLSTRITQTQLLSGQNTPAGRAGLQVEVYASTYRPFPMTHDAIAEVVSKEVQAMGLIDAIDAMHTHFVPFANIIFDHQRRAAQDHIFNFLSCHGLQRESDDLQPMTNWQDAAMFDAVPQLVLAGRFGQWKYFWSDDCLLRGRQVAGCDA